MSATIAGFFFEAIGLTREETVAKLDELGMVCLDALGGAPWIVVDDDTQKVRAETLIRDEQGFCYLGRRKYVFGGPVVEQTPGHPHHDGFQCQKEVV